MKIVEHAEKRAEDLKLLELISSKRSDSSYGKGYRAGYRDALADVIEDLMERDDAPNTGGTLAH